VSKRTAKNHYAQGYRTVAAHCVGRRSSPIRQVAGAGVQKPKPKPIWSADKPAKAAPPDPRSAERAHVLATIERVKRDETLSQTRREVALQRLQRVLAEVDQECAP
jgi:hypothetical protein